MRRKESPVHCEQIRQEWVSLSYSSSLGEKVSSFHHQLDVSCSHPMAFSCNGKVTRLQAWRTMLMHGRLAVSALPIMPVTSVLYLVAKTFCSILCVSTLYTSSKEEAIPPSSHFQEDNFSPVSPYHLLRDKFRSPSSWLEPVRKELYKRAFSRLHCHLNLNQQNRTGTH